MLRELNTANNKNLKKFQGLIVANQRKVRMLYFIIWISNVVLSETSNTFCLKILSIQNLFLVLTIAGYWENIKNISIKWIYPNCLKKKLQSRCLIGYKIRL